MSVLFMIIPVETPIIYDVAYAFSDVGTVLQPEIASINANIQDELIKIFFISISLFVKYEFVIY